MPRYRLLVAYDGTGFCGWQKQEPPVRPEGGGPSPYSEVTPMLHAEGEAGGREGRVALRTVQGVLERAVREVVREPVEVIGASRTDSGVHAEGQVAAFTCEPREVEQTEAGAGPVVMRGVGWPVERGADRLAAAINSRLPEDVLVRAASVAARDFDPVGDVVAKGYSYTLHVGLERPLFDRALVHHVFWRNGLNLGAMAEAAAMMEGEHDFAGFAAAGHGRLSTVRRVLSCRVVAISPERVRLDVAGTGFLWNMVRIMSGTLLEVGTGRRTLEQVAAAPRMAMARVGTPERVSQERLALGEEPEKWSGRLVDMGLREFGLFRFLTRMSAARMAEARAAGDVAEFTRAAEHALAVARASTHQGGLIARLLGAAVQALTIDQVMIGVRVLKPSDAELAALAEVFRRQVGRLPPPRLAVGSERLLALDTCRVAFAADGKVDLNALGAITQTSLPAAAMPVVVRATREGNVAAVTDAYERLARWWDSPRAQRDQADSPDVVSERWRQDPQGLVVGLLLPAVERAAKVDDQVALRRQGVLAMLAVERYQRATGAYPADLAAVVAKRLLAAVPTDPVTGKPLGYRRLEKPDEAGRSYVLYSVGFDGVDDGGRELTEEQGGFTRAIQGPKVEGGADAVLTPGLR